MSLVNAVLYKDSGSFALYDGRDASCYSPYQASSRLIGKGEDKKLFLTRLRQWSATQPNTCIKLKIFMWLPVYVHFNFECWILLHPNSTIITSYVMTASSDSLSMKEIKEGDDFNLICKVLLGQHVFIAFQCILGSKCLILFENHV